MLAVFPEGAGMLGKSHWAGLHGAGASIVESAS